MSTTTINRRQETEREPADVREGVLPTINRMPVLVLIARQRGAITANFVLPNGDYDINSSHPTSASPPLPSLPEGDVGIGDPNGDYDMGNDRTA